MREQEIIVTLEILDDFDADYFKELLNQLCKEFDSVMSFSTEWYLHDRD